MGEPIDFQKCFDLAQDELRDYRQLMDANLAAVEQYCRQNAQMRDATKDYGAASELTIVAEKIAAIRQIRP